MFPDAVPLGVRTAEEDRMMLNPPDEYVLQKGVPISAPAQSLTVKLTPTATLNSTLALTQP